MEASSRPSLLLSIVWVALGVVVAQPCDQNIEGQLLSDCPLPVIYTDPAKPVELHFTTATSKFPTATLTSRVFALPNSPGMVPAPTMHVKRGTTFQVTVHNDLGTSGQTASRALNGFGDANTTNLHLHGLHINSKFPGDDMSIRIEPETSFTYTYTIPENHAGGLFMWHTHHHGSVSLQYAGGAVGLLVVDDDDTNSPQGFLQTMESTLLLLENVEPKEVLDFGAMCKDEIVNDIPDETDFYLINGLVRPVLTLPKNRWHRLRISHASVALPVNTSIPGCDMVLCALDGVYLFEPRTTTFLEFLPPSRADLAIRCPADTFIADDKGRVLGQIAVDDAMPGPDNIDLSKWNWERPEYLQDLRGADITPSWTADVDLYRPIINRKTYRGIDRKVALHEVALNSVEEWRFNTVAHPMHMHVFHYQLVKDSSYFYKAGDYVDTIQGNGVMVRVLFMDHPGSAMIHCHVLRHEDQGLMGHIWVRDTNESLLPGPDKPKNRPLPAANTAGRSRAWRGEMMIGLVLMIANALVL